MKNVKLAWKHNYGDGEETYDWVLWIDRVPTKHIISQNSGIYFWYIDDVEQGMADSLKEAKELILHELSLDD